MARVALVSAAAPSPVSGAAITLLELAHSLARLGWSVDLHLPSRSQVPETDAVRAFSYPSVPVPGYAAMRYPWSITHGILRRAPRPDVLHLLTAGPWEFFVMRKLRSRDKPCVVSHLVDMRCFAPVVSRLRPGQLGFIAAWSAFQHMCCTAASAIHALNPRMAADLRRRYGKPVILIPPGVDPRLISRARLTSRGRTDGGACRKGVRLIYAGRLSHEKGIDRVIDAATWLPSSRLTLIGTGPLETWVHTQLCQRRIKARVALLGELPHDEVLGHLSCADVLLLPSRSEQFGLAALEAASVGCGVVSLSALDGPRYLAQMFPDSVRLLHEWSARELVEAVGSLCNVRRSRPAERVPDWMSGAKELEKLYDALLRGKLGAPRDRQQSVEIREREQRLREPSAVDAAA